MKKVFLKLPQNSQENICARVTFLLETPFSQNTSWRKPLDVSSGETNAFEINFLMAKKPLRF